MGLNRKSDGSYAVGVGVPDESAWQNDVWNSGGENLPNNCVLELPEPTSEDVGKTLTVEAKVVDDKVVAPEQTSTYVEKYNVYPLDLDSFDASLFVDGATVKVSIANVEDFVGTVHYFEDDPSYEVGDGENFSASTWGVVYFPTEPSLGALYGGDDTPPETITVTITTVRTEYEWSAVTPSGGGGYDIEIVCNKGPSDAAYTDLTITSGSIEALEAKVANGEIVKGRLAFSYQYSEGNPVNTQYILELGRFDGAYSAMEFLCGIAKVTVGYNSSYEITSMSLS